MANFVTSPNMNLSIPAVGIDPGPEWAQDLNNSLTLIDQHNHTPGYGVQIPPAGLNINSDLTFQSNNATNLRSVRFTPQSAILTGALDLGCLYEVTNDLYYNDGAGNNIRLTLNGSIAGTTGSISGLVPPASVSYVSFTDTFVFQSNTNTPGNLDAGSVTIRNVAANSPGITLSAPATLASDYDITLPIELAPYNANPLITSAGNTLLIKGYDAIVGSSGQVADGFANYTSLSAALSASASGWQILILPGTYTESPTISQSALVITGYKASIITGNLSFIGGTYNTLEGFSLTGNISLDATSTGNTLTNLFVSSGLVWSDLSAGYGNYCVLVQG